MAERYRKFPLQPFFTNVLHIVFSISVYYYFIYNYLCAKN
jgi:hypothetical protein